MLEAVEVGLGWPTQGTGALGFSWLDATGTRECVTRSGDQGGVELLLNMDPVPQGGVEGVVKEVGTFVVFPIDDCCFCAAFLARNFDAVSAAEWAAEEEKDVGLPVRSSAADVGWRWRRGSRWCDGDGSRRRDDLVGCSRLRVNGGPP